jgi:transcription-repair coupling factor (superfamily II helicase)
VEKVNTGSLSLKSEISGIINETAKTYLFFTSRLTDKEAVIFWFCKDYREKERVYQNIIFWQKHFKSDLPVFQFSGGDYQLLEKIINRKKSLIILSLDDLDSPLPKKDEVTSNIETLELKQTISPAQISADLVKIGYGFDSHCAEKGVFSRHGGIIDIFPINHEQPIKIEFLGNQIESLRTFDLISKKPVESLENIKIFPAKLNNNHATIIDYFDSSTTFIFSDPDQFIEYFPAWQEIKNKIERNKQIIFQTFPSDKTVNYDFASSTFYHHRLNILINDLKKYLHNNFQIILSTQKTKELEQLIETKAKTILKNIKITEFSSFLLDGFVSQKNKILYLTDKEIFGLEKIKEKIPLRKRIDLAFITELSPNDFIVHLDHGIGRFKGMVRQKIDGIEKEYFLLEYAEKDKLYLPIENADRISKYIGSPHPILSRLSRSNWQSVTHKIKEDALKIAQELLKLQAFRQISKTEAFQKDTEQDKQLEHSFLYQETPDQKRAIFEVKQDLEQPRPMDRLICGDVGFGKTEVAIRAAFKATANNRQVAILSPTTILTQQHYDTFVERLKNFPVKIEVLSRFKTESEQKRIIQDLKNGLIDIIIGTHRLLSKDIKFKNLGLIIIDEEQRFGVNAKEKLKSLRSQTHLLTLTATPIPRTLNLSLSGLKDVSLIETPPHDRLPIETIIKPYDEELVKEAIESEIKRKGQVYYLYNKVETINPKANQVQKIAPQAKIGVAHGQLNEKDLAKTMKDFDNQKIDVLVCSTIIENGLDLPNVNTLIVENAPQFGLSGLYQLRGRIGRSGKQAFSYFLYHSEKLNEGAKKRLQALLEAKELGSGFQLAMRDLEIRGIGNILGKEQHGHIKAVGLNLYTRLLNQAIYELKTGIPQKPLREVSLDLPFEVGIPKDFIESEAKRLKIYQQLANLTETEDLAEYKKKTFKAKTLPKTLENLFKVLEMKIIAQKTDITEIKLVKMSLEGITNEKILIKFLKPLTPKLIENLVKINPAWDLLESQIKIEKDKLDKDWFTTLKKCVRLFVGR